MCFYESMMRMPWTNKKNGEDFLKEVNLSRQLATRIRRRHSAFFGHIMKIGRYLDSRKRINQEKMLDSLALWQQEHWNGPGQDARQFAVMAAGTLE